MSYTINDIAAIVGSSKRFEKNDVIDQLLIDSRKVYFPATSLFIALKGANKNGAGFIASAYENGVRNFLVNDIDHESKFTGANFIVVDDTLKSLQVLASRHRNDFKIPVVGITGSNGKTIVKELLYQLLYADYNIVRSPKSYNSQIGVPLSIWQLNAYNTLALFEAGISKPGEMDNLEKIIRPSTGIFTFIGDAHAEGFTSVEEKVQEKLLLFRQSELLIYRKDEKIVDDKVLHWLLPQNPSLKLFTWGLHEAATLRIQWISKGVDHTDITCLFEEENFHFSIPFTDDASVHNAITCCAFLLSQKFPPVIISQRMPELKQVEMRLELKQGNNNCSIINDSYSADINSLGIALDFLGQQQQHSKRTLILSDLLQAAQQGEALYKMIAAIVAKKELYRFIGIGPQMKKYAYLFSDHTQSLFFDSTESFLKDLPVLHFSDETILLKGARMFEFERISNVLEQKTHQTLLEINLNALRHNLDVYRRQLKPGVKLMAMVKAFSYGSGSFEIANLLQHAGVDYLAVAYADEGIELRKTGIRLPIMVMNVEAETFSSLIQYQLEPELYSFNILRSFSQYLQQRRLTNYPVHVKLDTGMHRLGFEEKDIETLVEVLRGNELFNIRSVFSHLVATDDPVHDAFTHQQAESFTRMADKIAAATGQEFIRHISNTSGIARLPHLQLNMVRLGIGLYGVDANPEIQKQLRTVATLKTTIAQIKSVKAGESVGYSRKGIAHRDSIIATVRIGYADGYRRILGNGKGRMYLNGHLVPVIGNVCMDMTMLDITDVVASEEDEVIVFGEQAPVYELAKAADTIAYEILTGISQRVKRVYFEE